MTGVQTTIGFIRAKESIQDIAGQLKHKWITLTEDTTVNHPDGNWPNGVRIITINKKYIIQFYDL